MVVLATGRDDLLKDLSISMTSFGASDIKSLRIQNIADLADYTPNLEINTRSAASNPTLFIRGIGLKDYNANAAGAVAVYQDGVNINSPAIQLGQLFDTEEVLVLRGPQGSMNGRNATAGAIMINSVLPDGELDASGSFSYGNYNSVNVEGAIAFPVVEDLLSTRMSFTANFRDGTTENHCADWDPERFDKPVLNEETIRAAWVANGSPTTAAEGLSGCRGGLGCQFPNASKANRQTDNGDIPIAQGGTGRRLNPDEICIWNDPGSLRFGVAGQEGEPVWVANSDENVRTPADFQGLDQHVNNVKNWAARGIVRLVPDVGDGMDWILNFHGGQNLGDSRRLQSLRTTYTHNDGDPFIVENVEGPSEALAAQNSGLEGIRSVKGLFEKDSTADNLVPGGRGGSDVDGGFYDMDGDEKLDTWGVNLRGLWDTGSVVVTSLTGYEWYDRKIDDEGDAVPIAAFPGVFEDSAWQVSQEVRVAGEGERYRWFLGGFLLRDELDSKNLFPGLRSRRIEQKFTQTLTSGAVYASGRYWLLDEMYLDAGVRYNNETKDFSLESTVNALEGNFFNAIPKDSESETWTGVTGDATLAWEPGGDWMYDARLDFLNLYVKYGRGMKGGHFNAGLTIQSNVSQKQRIEDVDPEFLHSLEVGFKSRWLQNRVVMNFAFFRYWYEDLQVFDFTNEVGELPIQQLLNSDANVLGAELELQLRPFPGFLVQVGGGWLDTEFVDFTVNKATSQPRGIGTPVEFDYSGNPLISAPEWNLSGVAEYQLSLSSWGFLVPQYTASYRSRVYLDPQKLDAISEGGFWKHNVRLSYRTLDGRYEISGWVENLTDERYKVDAFDLSLGQNEILEVWNDPRMYGLTVSAYF
jgi:iron complex outermembrane receptor protein